MKKKQPLNTKDHFWAVTNRSKEQAKSWMSDLSGSKPLAQLAKKVPTYNKREDILQNLVEHSVPLVRATWFLKVCVST